MPPGIVAFVKNHCGSFNLSTGKQGSAASSVDKICAFWLPLTMSAAEQLWFLVGACFVVCVAADPGDDFSNNLFSDLAPCVS